MPMRILVNGTAAMPGTAADVYLREMLPALAATGNVTCAVALTARQPSIAERLRGLADVAIVDVPAGGVRRGLALQRALPAAARRAGADLLFTGGNFFVRRSGVPQVCLIENANVLSHPSIEWRARDRLRNLLLRRLTRGAFEHADQLVFPSADAAARFTEHGAPRERSHVVPHAWRPAPAVSASPGVAGPFLLCVSSVYPHKNLPRLVRGFQHLVERCAYPGTLAIVGYSGRSAYRADVDRAIAECGLGQRVRLLPAMDPGELAALYHRAGLVVMPSIEETFGLPALEALGYGRPLAAADTALSGRGAGFFNPFREICGDAAVYFDPFTPAAIGDAMATALEPSTAERLSRLGPPRAARFTWDASARALAAVFARALASPRR